MVYYRKYRPQTIAELDSTKPRETLTAVLSTGDVPHAFLLTGPKGLGKTSTARIIAKVVNCENRKKGSIEPCGTCDQCISITNGNNIDVLEIDGASNRGIDEIRDLRDKVKLAPSRAKKKVYIIDEVHMLTTEAFNALLKTVEEPPPHVMFIFCTTEPHKVPETIISRCFHAIFPKATQEDIVHALERVVKGEKIEIDIAALQEIAKMADGGFRDATKILEEVVLVAGGKKIDKKFLEEKFQISNIQFQISNFLEQLAKRDAKETLEIISQVAKQGTDMRYFIGQLLETLHEMLLEHIGILSKAYDLRPMTYDLRDIQALASLFSASYQETKYAVIPQLPLELAVVTWCQQSDQGPVILGSDERSDGDRLLDKGGETTPESDPGQARMTSKTHNSMGAFLKKEKNLKVQALLRGTKEPKEPEEPKAKGEQEELSEKPTAEQFMENLIYKIKPINFSVAGVLRGCVVKKMGDGEVIFETTYKFHKERLDEIKTQEVLERAIKEITGKNMKVMVELTNKSKM